MGKSFLIENKMGDDHEEEFDTADAGALTYPLQCGSLKKGMYVMIDGKPCKVVEITTSKTGKHGHAKANIVATDIFTGKKLEDSQPTSHNVNCPNVTRTDYQYVGSDEQGNVTYLDEENEYKEDLKFPTDDDSKELVENIKAAEEEGKNILISVIKAMKEEKIVAFRENNKV